MFKSKLSKVIVSLLRRIAGVTRSGAKRLMRAMLQALMAMSRRAKLPVAGFVLPTVTMVLLVVILLTVAITLRSFDRANTARNVRVNQQVLAAATPALDRAKAKIQFLLQQTQGRGTPSEKDLYFPLTNPPSTSTEDAYTFGDEERLRIKYDLDESGSISPDLRANDPNFIIEKNESINTAWRYPVDTNSDGKFDNFTLYGIFFRTPEREDKEGPTLGEFKRERKPLDARTPPLSTGKANCKQGGGTVASLAGDSGWYRIDGKLKKSFFVYTVNVPMTDVDAAKDPTYQKFTGSATSISAMEYQQDQTIIPLANNAVVYENDLDISPGPGLNLNGRVFTNSNLLTTSGAKEVKLYQVSSPESCYYEQENSKIVVSGNVVNGWALNNTSKIPVEVHLFKKKAADIVDKNIQIKKDGAESASNLSLDVLYNDEAYTKRLDLLVQTQMGAPVPATGEPDPKVQPSDPLSVQRKPESQSREDALKEYFKQVLRKVPFAEVPLIGGDGTAGYGLPWSVPPGASPVLGTKDTLRAVNKWSDLKTTETKINLIDNQLESLDPSKEPEEEKYLGDRVLAGNNLPAKRWDSTASELTTKPEELTGQKWNKTDPLDPNFPRQRSSQVTKLADVGASDRDGFWEQQAATVPKNPLDGNGGLRIVTGAGVYERKNSFLPPPTWINPATGGPLVPPLQGDTATYNDPATPATETFPVVWPDSMPMSPLGQGSQVYNNNSASGTLGWKLWPGTVLPTTPAQPPGGLPPSGLSLAAGSLIDPNTRQYAKGDLRMRATAVYHYADNGYDPTKLTAGTEPDQTPIACISSYYDPSTASTAKNLSTLPADVSGDTSLGARGTQIGSNNGITYGAPTRPRPATSTLNTATGLLSGGDPILEAQANLVFPDGRFANGPLRKALPLAETKRTLADKAAIDSTNCALQILKGELTANPALIPHGAIKEVAFLNGREIKAIDRDDQTTPNVNEAFTLSSPLTDVSAISKKANLTGNYNLPLEERQPLEIRATQIDLNLLRDKAKTSVSEPLLPNSGIIYATRDDALPDRSFRTGVAGGGMDEGRSKNVSPTDSLLDPTRKPNAILLVNGKELGRIPGKSATVADIVKEKGLTLVSDLPVYIQGEFNIHSGEEFVDAEKVVGTDWSKFYARKNLNNNFACRPNDPRLGGKCTTADTWRPANVLGDAVTLFSKNYRFGFRNEGDFDLRNNAGAAAVLPRKQQGFYANNFVTNGLSSGAFKATAGKLVDTAGTKIEDTDYADKKANAVNSSYFNNFVTPVQRRGKFPEYVMEVCNKIPVSACTDGDWFVNPVTGGKATVGEDIGTNNYIAGTTAIPPAPELQRFPRRVAFERTGNALKSITAPVPLGISGTTVAAAGSSTNLTANSLWFATTVTAGANAPVTYGSEKFPYVFNQAVKDGSGADMPKLTTTSPPPTLTDSSQPLLMPVLQIQTVIAAPGASASVNLPPIASTDIVTNTGWIPRADANTTFNMVVGSNDTPSRAMDNGIGDFNGGMQNLPRFLESWNSGIISTTIQGSFIQFGRSAYSTAPYTPILDPKALPAAPIDNKLRSLFDKPPVNPFLNTAVPRPSYATDNAGGRVPFFSPPGRQWGYDVGLLSQPPDLFTRKFTTPPSKRTPDEYFREVSRDDEWVQALLCSFIDKDGTTKAVTNTALRPTNNFCIKKAGA